MEVLKVKVLATFQGWHKTMRILEEINCSLFDLNGKLIISGNIDLLTSLSN